MAEPFLGEIRAFSFNYAPRGWAICSGQLLPCAQYQPLFSLLGVAYGGDGRVSFGLPNLMGRTPLHAGSAGAPGNKGGAESVILATPQIPEHTHAFKATSVAATAQTPQGNALASASRNIYGSFVNLMAMNPAAISTVGGGLAHENMQPYLVINFCIALQGIFPSRP